MNDRILPGGQLFAPPRDSTEENAEKINEVESLFEACVEEIRFLLEESDVLEVDILEILRQVSDMSALQGRLRDLRREQAELEKGEET